MNNHASLILVPHNGINFYIVNKNI